MNSLQGKTLFISGASRGIGRASALALAKAGAQVLVHYSTGEADAQAVVAEIRDSGGRADALGADLSKPDGAHALAAEARRIVGEESVGRTIVKELHERLPVAGPPGT